jgi:L,D-peptidoglycan transpeptidase YkuD (ErfK/YbiS/YcfS/YnhG family)
MGILVEKRDLATNFIRDLILTCCLGKAGRISKKQEGLGHEF